MIGSTDNSVSYAGNNSAVTAYAVPFRFDDPSWLFVEVTTAGAVVALNYPAGYTIGGSGSASTATVTTTAAIPPESTIRFYRQTPALQPLQLINGEPLPGPSVESTLDKLAMAIQDGNPGPIGPIGVVPDVLRPQSIEIPDVTGLISGMGELGLDSGVLTVGDSVTVGGKPVVPSRVKGLGFKVFTGLPKAGTAIAIVGFPVPATMMTEGQVFKIRAKANFSVYGATFTTTQFIVGFAWDNAKTQLITDSLGWQSVDLHPNGSSVIVSQVESAINIDSPLYDVDVGDLVLDTSGVRAVVRGTNVIYSTGNDPIKTSPNRTLNSNLTEASDAGAATMLWLMLQLADSGGGNFGAATVMVDYDVEYSFP